MTDQTRTRQWEHDSIVLNRVGWLLAEKLTGRPGAEHHHRDPLEDAVAVIGQLDGLRAELRHWRQGVFELRQKMVEAVEHDRQPYPTADAYERACAAYRHYRALARKAVAVAVEYATGDTDEQRQAIAELQAGVDAGPDLPDGSLYAQVIALRAERDEALELRDAAVRNWVGVQDEYERLLPVLETAKPLVAHAKQSTAPRTPAFEALIAAVDEWRTQTEAGDGRT
jgi:hypothetical protein